MTYIELQATSHFSFLRGVSSAEELFAAAALLGYKALGLTDRNSVGGLVKGLRASDATGVRMVAGARLDLMDGSALLVWPQDRAAWSRLTRLLSTGKGRADRKKGEKGQCFLHWEDVAAWSEGLVAALVPDEADRVADIALAQMADIFGARGHLALTHRRRPGEAKRLHALDALARRHGLRSLATGDVLYDGPDKRMLHDVVTAIREHVTIDELGFRRERFADRHLKSSGGDGAPLRRLPRRDQGDGRHRRALHLLDAGARLPISRRDRHVGPLAAGRAGAADPRRHGGPVPGRRPASLCGPAGA